MIAHGEAATGDYFAAMSETTLMLMSRPTRRFLSFASLGLAVTTIATFFGCVRHSGGTWAFDSAPLPDGWPALTPVGEVQVRTYPVVRAAMVRDVDLPKDGQGAMFRELFRHIKQRDIAMTAPVEMSYSESDDGSPTMAEMGFYYRRLDMGEAGPAGAVRVVDQAEQAFATVGTRGSYSASRYARGLELIEAFLAGSSQWQAAGEPRFLGYNGPFTPWFWRYGEVQVPVAPR